MEEALLIVLGAGLGFLGGWLADVRRSRENSRTRWLDIRRVTYAAFLSAVREVREPLADFIRGNMTREEAARSVLEPLRSVEARRAEVWVIADAAPSSTSEHLRDWCQDAELMLRVTKYSEDELVNHLRFFDGPFSSFFDACRSDLGLPAIKTAFHIRKDQTGPDGKENPYKPA